MLASILAVLLGLTIGTLYIGIKYDFVLQLFGFLFLFLLGFALLDGVTYESGFSQDEVVTNSSTSITRTTTYSTVSTTKWAIFTMLAGFIGFILSLLDLRNDWGMFRRESL